MISSYTVICENDTFVLIKDNDTEGFANVTTAASYTIESLAENYDIANRRVIYQDSMKRFDELVHKNGIFTRFNPLSQNQQIFFSKLLEQERKTVSTNNPIIDFSAHLNRKRQCAKLKERIATSGWEIDGDVSSCDSDVCFYLIDSIEPGIVLFGNNKSSIISPERNLVHWGHFVLAWDVIADPSMPYDEVHKNNTIELAIRALPSLAEWDSCTEKALTMDEGQKAHILVVIDRENMDAPLELIVAISDMSVMNPQSIRSIVNNYIKEQ